MFRRLMQTVTTLTLALVSAMAGAGTILQYHHVSADTPPVTSVTPAQFADHLSRLKREGFQVVRLDKLLERARAGEDTTDQVAITFDDAYLSIADNAMPLLAKYGWPAAVFVTTSQVGGEQMLTVGQLRQIAAAGHMVLNHAHQHLHVVRRLADETDAQRLDRVREDILTAQHWLETTLSGAVPRILAWPYGEHDAGTRALAEEMGFTALAQVSGAVGPQTDWQAVPRIAVNQHYADWSALRDKLRARPLPVTVLSPEDGVTDTPRPALSLALHASPQSLNCFMDGRPQAISDVTRIDSGQWQLVLQPSKELAPGRHRVTCTRATEGGRFQWFSWLWMVRGEDGWYPES